MPGTGLFGIATAKAIGCHAWRNRQKRRIRAASQSLTGRENFDLVISVKAKAREAKFQDIQAEIEKLTDHLKTRWESESACS